MPKNIPSTDQTAMAGDVDRLLRQLSPEAAAHARPRPMMTPSPRTKLSRPRVAPAGPTPLGVWARVVITALAAVAMTQWPYAVCGFPLAAYLAAVAVVLVAGGWAAHAAWRAGMGAAHVAAIVLLFTGATLGALQVLPRLGYAPVETTWRCPG